MAGSAEDDGDLPSGVAAELRLQRALQGPVGDQELAEKLERANVHPEPAVMAAARAVAGPWLPEPRSRPLRGWRPRRSERAERRLTRVLQRVMDLHAALVEAGEARAAWYRAHPTDEASGTRSRGPGADEAAARWSQAVRQVRPCQKALDAAVGELQRRERLVRRMVAVWRELAIDRLYFGTSPPHRDLPALEDRARELVAVLAEDRCPPGAPRELKLRHRAVHGSGRLGSFLG